VSIELIELAGAPHEMGLKHGSLLKDRVRALVEERIRLSMEHAAADGRRPSREECLGLAAEHVEKMKAYSDVVFEEFRGIAEGAEVSLEELLIGNGYTDYRDVARQRFAGGCTSFAVSGRATKSKRAFIGQTWDMDASAEPFVVLFRRRPTGGPESLTMTTTGCLSLVGIQEEGVAICNNNLVPTDARPGVMYLAIIHNVLSKWNMTDAVAAITECHRASGHNYLLTDATGRARDVETSAADHEVILPDTSAYVHTNHYTSPRLQAEKAAADPGPNSLKRQKRLQQLFEDQPDGHTIETLHQLLCDHENGPNAICRHGDGAKTCAAAIMCPWTREIWATVGNPCENELTSFSLYA